MPSPTASGPVPETALLKPLNPHIHEDDYEIYELSDVTVYDQLTNTPANLLYAFPDTPLRLEGKLSNVKPQCLLQKPFRPCVVEVRDITQFSYGLDGNGNAVLWAQGRAGWFEILPSRVYRDIFKDMLEAVQMWFFMVDIQESFQAKRKGAGPSAQLVFQEYAEDERYKCEDEEEAERRFAKHRACYAMLFWQRKGGIPWMSTPLGQWLKKNFPQDYESAKARIDGRFVGAQLSDKPAANSSRLIAKPKSNTRSKVTEAPKKDDNWWEAAALFAFMQKAINLGAMHIGHVTLDKVSRLLVKRYEIDDETVARNVLIAHADNLIYMMDHPKRKSTRHFATESIHNDLSAGHSLSAGDIRRALAVQLRPRNDHSLMNSDMDSDSSSSSSEEELELETPESRPRHKKIGTLSVLRPKSSKYSGKGKTVKPGEGSKGKGKGKAPADTSSEASDIEPAAAEGVESEDDIAIDTPTHPLLSPGLMLKRKHEPDALDELTIYPNPRKRATSNTRDEPLASLSTPSSPSSSASSTYPADAPPLPVRIVASGTSSAQTHGRSAFNLLPTIVSTPLPSITANGPGDTWSCEVDGCTQKVYGASTELGQNLIGEHLEDHEKGRVGEVGLVVKEGQGLRLPVSHLLDKIRQVSETKEQLFPSSTGLNGVGGGMRQPTPVQRAL